MDSDDHAQWYEALAGALDRLPNGYPRTQSGVEILILRRMYSPEEARLASLMGREAEPFQAIAARAGLPPAEARHRLVAMARRELVWPEKTASGLSFRLAPFIVGAYEGQAATIDHELAHLVQAYMEQGGARGIMGPEPALHRVVPAHGSVKSELILPYADVRALLAGAKRFTVTNCICRKQQALVRGSPCSFALHNCLSFSASARPAGPDDISREQALAILDEAEEAGLVHTVSNVLAGVSYVCNCCGCCCGILLGITRYGLEHSVASAPYLASIDPGRCTGCGTCVERCQVKAIVERDGVSVVDPRRCIGCGLCVTGCPSEAARLERQPEVDVAPPPADFASWERVRLASRRTAGS
jgi:electron transport complex protein RnfB